MVDRGGPGQPTVGWGTHLLRVPYVGQRLGKLCPLLHRSGVNPPRFLDDRVAAATHIDADAGDINFVVLEVLREPVGGVTATPYDVCIAAPPAPNPHSERAGAGGAPASCERI